MALTLLNGRLPSTMLTTAYKNPDQRIRRGKAATGFMRLSQRSYCKGFGFIDITDGYRSYAKSEELFLAHYVPGRLLAGRRWYDSWFWKGEYWYRISGTARIAPPGYSNHGWGLALDLAEPYASGGPKHDWLEDRAPFYGFWNEGRNFGEKWHWLSRNAFPARPALHLGSHGDAVVAWQCVLRFDLPGISIELDGKFGRKTGGFTKTWRAHHGLDRIPDVGPKAWAKAGLA